jgi:acyl-homoserine lactone acylase PvdQ
VKSTVRGPVVNAIIPQMAAGGDPVTSLRWVGAEHLNDIRASINVGRAQNWEQFRDALRDWAVAVFNWVYADSSGNAGYQMAGRLGARHCWRGIRTSPSGSLRAGTSMGCMDRRMMQPAPARWGCRGCGGAATGPLHSRSPTTWP